MNTEYLSRIKVTYFINKQEVKAGNDIETGGGRLTTLKDVYETHNIFGCLQTNTKGERLKLHSSDGTENYIIEYIDGLIFVDIDNKNEINWKKEDTVNIANKLNNYLQGREGYIWTEISKSEKGIHVIYYIPLTAIALNDKYKEYYTNAALVYNRIFNFLKEEFPNLNEDYILSNNLLDPHSFSLVQVLDYKSSIDYVYLNKSYTESNNNFENYLSNMDNNFQNYTSLYGDYTNILKQANVHKKICDMVYKKLYKEENKDLYVNNFIKLNAGDIPDEIFYVADNKLIMGNANRLQLAYTLMNFYTAEQTICIGMKFWELYHSSKSNKAKALSDFKYITAHFKGQTPNARIIEFLNKHGFKITTEFKKTDKFYGIEGTGFNGLPADESIYLENDFISDHYDRIINKLKEHKNVYIKAGCGVGKSNFFRTLIEKEEKVCIVCHLNSIKEGVYGKRNIDNKEEKSFNTTPEYLFDLSYTDTLKNYLVSPKQINDWINSNSNFINNKIVVSWDGYQRLIENDKFRYILNDYIKCIDESHNLVAALSYRNTKTGHKKEGTISALSNSKYNFSKTIFCSGTPQNEYQLFNDVFKFEFFKEDPINYTWEYIQINAKQKEGRGTCEKGAHAFSEWFRKTIDVNYFDKIMIYSNTLSDNIEEHLAKDTVYDICNFRRDICIAGDESCSNILYSNNLKEKIIVSTVYGSQGIEIKNNIDRLLCIFIAEDTTKTDIIQTIHRFRCVKNVHSVICEITPNVFTDIDISKYIKAIDNLKNIDDKTRQELKENQNYFATKLLKRDNTDFQNSDIILAELYYNYLQNENITPNKIKEWFEPNLKISIVNVESTDTLPLITKEMEDNYKTFRTEHINEFIKYTGISDADVFIGSFMQNYKISKYEKRQIEKDLERMKAIKYLVSPHDDNYSDINTEEIIQDNMVKIVNAFTYSLNKDKTVNTFKITACLNFLKARNKIHKHLISKGIYLGNLLSMDEKYFIDTLGNIKEIYIKHAKRLGIDNVHRITITNNEDGTKDYKMPDGYYDIEKSVIEPNFVMLYKHDEFNIDYLGRTKEYHRNENTKARIKLKYQLISDPNVKMYNHTETYNYVISVLGLNISKLTWTKKCRWKEYFVKL